MSVDAPLALPVIESGPPRERPDAARNRARILAAAERLFSEEGDGAVSMDAVARAACVGKGTLYRRFGDRDGLLLAVIDERHQIFQEELLRGAPPLGPGASSHERLQAFGPAYLDLVEEAGPALAAFEEGAAGSRFLGGPYASYRLHLRILLRQADPTCDAEWWAEELLATMRASHVQHLARLGLDGARLVAGWIALVEAATKTCRA